MQYRPNGWEELKAKQMEGIPEILGGNRDFFIEAGADAYEEGLRTDGRIDVLSYEWCIGAVEWASKRGGHLVFIPEDGCDSGETLNANALYEEKK